MLPHFYTLRWGGLVGLPVDTFTLNLSDVLALENQGDCFGFLGPCLGVKLPSSVMVSSSTSSCVSLSLGVNLVAGVSCGSRSSSDESISLLLDVRSCSTR